jgi:glycosyl transferase family 4
VTRSVLFVCASFPPAVGGGSVRNIQTARGLAERGWRVTVLTAQNRSTVWQDASPLARLPNTVRVVRATMPDLSAFARRVAAIGRPASGAGTAVPERPSGKMRDFVLTWLLIPDAYAPWIPFAIRSGSRVLRTDRPAALLTAGPPQSSHVVGYALRARANVRWVVDSQDPWADNPFPTSSWRARRAIDSWLEGRVFRRANVVVSATESQTVRFRAAYASASTRFETLYSGYDEREFADIDPRSGAKRLLLHLGSFYGARSPAPFLVAVHALAVDEPALVANLEVLLAGYADPANERAIADAIANPPLAGLVRYVPVLPRRESLELMLGAFALLLVTDPGAGGRDLIPIKTFEYLRAGRPILALVPEGETSRLLQRTGGAVVAHPGEVGAIRKALAALLEKPERVKVRDPAVVASMEFSRSLDSLSDLLEAEGLGGAR